MTEKISLLLVEDEPFIRDIIAVALEDVGLSVIAIESGAEAVAIIDGKEIEVSALITDVRLGKGLDGWEVARRCRRIKSALPVVYMTGDSAADWASAGVPGSILLQKPFAMQQIVAAISTLLSATSHIRNSVNFD